MATCEDVALSAMAAVNTDAGKLRTVRWVSERYRELTSQARFKHLRRIDAISIPAPLTAGTATATTGQNTITFDAVASPTLQTQVIGRHIRLQVNWYKVVELRPSPTAAIITIDTDYCETGGTLSYMIVQRFNLMPKNMRFMGEFAHMRLRRPLDQKTWLEANFEWPNRQNVVGSSGPTAVIDVGADPESAQRLVEFYPYSTLEEQVVFSWYPISRDLQVLDVLPPEIDVALLKAGVLIDIYRYEMAKSQRGGDVNSAGLWRNEVRAQETTWERKIQDLIRNDRSADDLKIILQIHEQQRRGFPLLAPGGFDGSGWPVPGSWWP